MIKIVLSLSICIFSSTALAVTNCGPYKVKTIQTQSNDILVEFLASNGTSYFKQIGLWSSSSTRPYLATIMQALAMDKSIMIRYNPDDYVCASTDYSNAPVMVRLIK